jgi:glycosyltransferase involved in cell wall biosynthesis
MTSVSAVIPTYRRPDLVIEAVRSVLAQTRPPEETIVVVDGLDQETVDALRPFASQGVRTIVPDQNLGNAEARNRGINEATGEWIALLDDDDLWFETKLETQLAALSRLDTKEPILSHRFEAVNEEARFVWPRRLPEPGQHVSEYLFCRRSPSTGEGGAQTSTLLARRELFLRVPFMSGLRRYVDLDWMLRAAEAGATLHFAGGDEPLSRWMMEAGRARISNETGWRWDRQWIRHRRHLVTDRAYAAFLLTLPSLTAARAGDASALLPLIGEAVRTHRPSAGELAFHLANLSLPRPVKGWLAGRAEAARGTAKAS